MLDSYEAERRPVQAAVIAEATANMSVLATLRRSNAADDQRSSIMLSPIIVLLLEES